MKKLLFFLLFVLTWSANAQTINQYQYLVVPLKFDFQNEINQYRLNSNVKYLMEKEGFTAFFSNEVMPKELAQDRCKAMYLDVEKASAFMATKLRVVLKDCQNNILYASPYGRSKEKKFELAYKEALLKAFESVKSLKYSFSAPAAVVVAAKAVEKNEAGVLFAQPTPNGYQLVDTTPKVVLKLTKTSQPDYFLANADGKQGVVYLKDGDWFFDYYLSDQLISEKLNLKF